MPITILLVDDHKVFRDALRRMLEGCAELLVVAEAGDGAEAIELAERHHPDVAVVDIGMKKMNGIETTARLLRRSPETAVLILTVYNDERYIASAAAAGAPLPLSPPGARRAARARALPASPLGTAWPSALPDARRARR